MSGLGSIGSSPLQFKLLGNSGVENAASGVGKMRYGKIDNLPETDEAGKAQGTAGSMLQGFSQALKHEMQNINELQAQADTAKQTYATGGDIELHNVMLAAEKAETTMQLAMQIRNKGIAAYQEISRMSV